MATGDLPPINNPAGYVTQHGMAFEDGGGRAVAVTTDAPLPVEVKAGSTTSTPLTGTDATPGTQDFGPFAPQLARPIWVTLSGTWSGSVQLLRSTDGGATKLPLTYSDGSVKAVWTGNANLPVVEESDAAASYYLRIVLASGNVIYRVAQ